MDAPTSPPPTRCDSCGERFRRGHDAAMHICAPNYTSYELDTAVTIGGLPGIVQQIDRGRVKVYVRESFQSLWVDAYDSRLERAE